MALNLGALEALPDLDYNSENAIEELESLATTWFLESDASLLHRLGWELAAIGKGYGEIFYPTIGSGALPLEGSEVQDAEGELFFRCSTDT